MKYTVESHMVPCECRSLDECYHNITVEITALEACVTDFAEQMKAKLRHNYMWKGHTGWDSPDWQPDEIKNQLRHHLEKGDMVDVANFAMFLWNRNG